MKKLLSVIIALAMVLSLFAASLADTAETQLVSDPARTDNRASLKKGESTESTEEPAEAPAEEPAEAEGYLAYIMYADAAWANQYWGTDDSAVKAENVYVTGAGDYTVGLDFTAVEGGQAEGLASSQ